MNPEILKEWATTAEAMKLLETSKTTIERLTAAGKLESKLVPVPRRRPQRVFLVKSLERLKAEREPATIKAERPKADIGDRQFLFHVGEGSVVVGIPKRLSQESVAAAIEFLQLIIRQLTRVIKQS
jgi:hypothetical protein